MMSQAISEVTEGCHKCYLKRAIFGSLCKRFGPYVTRTHYFSGDNYSACMKINTKNKSRIVVALLMVAVSISATPPASAIGSLYDGSSGDVACTTNGQPTGYFTINDNVVVANSNCAGSVVIPTGVTTIYPEAFLNATLVTGLTISNSVTTMGDRAFAGATSLVRITFGSGLTELASGVFQGATSLRSVVIPSTLTGIGAGAFAGATSLTRVIIPETIFFIWDESFSGTTSLHSIYFLGAAPSLVGTTPFLNTASDATAYVTEASLASFADAEGELWNGLVVRIGEPEVEVDPVNDNPEADIAAARAAQVRREEVKREARETLVSAIRDAKELTLETFAKADIPGITASNIDALQAELLALPIESRSDIDKVLKIAHKYEVVERIASDRVASILPKTFIEIGLIPETSKNKSALATVVKKLFAQDRDSLAEIKAAIEAESVRIAKRAERLAKLLAGKSGEKQK